MGFSFAAMALLDRRIPVTLADLWGVYQRLDERVSVHLEGMARYGDRLDAIETRLRSMETVESGTILRTMQAEQQRLRDRVEALQDSTSRAAPVLEGIVRIGGWIVAALIALVFAGVQLARDDGDDVRPLPTAGAQRGGTMATAGPDGVRVVGVGPALIRPAAGLATAVAADDAIGRSIGCDDETIGEADWSAAPIHRPVAGHR